MNTAFHMRGMLNYFLYSYLVSLTDDYYARQHLVQLQI